jgi:hypothetical protein
MPATNQNIEQILALYENNSDLLIEKVDEIRIILDTLMPLQYVIDIAKTMDEFKDNDVVKSINEQTNIFELSDKLCSVCIIKEKYIEYMTKFIQNLDQDIEADIADSEPYDESDNLEESITLGEEFGLDED